MKLKVITIIGTRPEIIRLSRVIAILDKFTNHIIVHTGQNYDYELNEIFFKDLEIRKPDYFLNVNTKSLGSVLGETIIKSESILIKEKPDAVLILGDTNSSIAALIAKRMKITIFHMEAGNRCFDLNVPEEINRRIIDHLSDFNLVYTENARRNLISEGLPHRNIYITGSPMKEVIMYYLEKIIKSDILQKLDLKEKNYFLVSMHREENVDNKSNLKELLNALTSLSKIYNKKIIISTHPRTKKRLKEIKFKIDKNFHFMQPFGYFDYVKLQLNAICTLSDSGTISEESSILNFPAVTIRNSMERPEAMDTGAIILTGINAENIINSVKMSIELQLNYSEYSVPNDYKIENTSLRVLKLIQGTALLSHKWNAIKSDKD
jgi:UDP-N-acetyl-L-fucosamine synthase